jgi:hypothetical protein
VRLLASLVARFQDEPPLPVLRLSRELLDELA